MVGTLLEVKVHQTQHQTMVYQRKQINLLKMIVQIILDMVVMVQTIMTKIVELVVLEFV